MATVNKRVLVEEIVIVEECADDDEEGEWELGEDGCWYCTVDEYYEEEEISPTSGKLEKIISRVPDVDVNSTTTTKPKESSSNTVKNQNTTIKSTSNPKTSNWVSAKSPRKTKEEQYPKLRATNTKSETSVSKARKRTPSSNKSTNGTWTSTSPSKKSTNQEEEKKSTTTTPGNSKRKSKTAKSTENQAALSTRGPTKKTIHTKSGPIDSPVSPVNRARGVDLKMTSLKSSPSHFLKGQREAVSSSSISGDNIIPNLSPQIVVQRRPSDSLTGRNSKDTVFGILLDKVLENQIEKGFDGEIPLVVRWTVEYLRIHGMKTNGIFRKSGHHGKQLEKQELIDSGASEEELKFNELDEHTVGAILRSYLRSLPNSIIPRTPFFPLLVQVSAFSDNDFRLNSFKSILKCLPKNRYNLLKYLSLFLYDVSQHNEVNLMSLSNIALVFAPSFFGTMDCDAGVLKESIDPMSMFKESKFTSMLTQEILSEAKYLFDDDGEPAKAYRATECFSPTNKKHISVLRGDTFLVLATPSMSDVTILIGDTTGKIPVAILNSMQEIPLQEVKVREIIGLFANGVQRAAHKRHDLVDLSPIERKARTPDVKRNKRRFTDVLRFNSNVIKRSSMIAVKDNS